MKNHLLFFTLLFCCASFVAVDPNEGIYVNVFEQPQIVEFNKTLKKKDCNNKYYLAIPMPKGAKGWIYSITTISKSESEHPQSVLLEKVQDLANKYDSSKLVDFIEPEESKRTFNLYILSEKEQADSFFNCGYYKYAEKHIQTKSRSAYLECANNETVFIGIENHKDLKNLRLKIEVVAVL